LARPHLGPLPLEEENGSTVAAEIDRKRLFVRQEAQCNGAAKTHAANELDESADAFSLSPGERAGVRAGVKPNCSPRASDPKPRFAKAIKWQQREWQKAFNPGSVT
jgi:hypothetical protein